MTAVGLEQGTAVICVAMVLGALAGTILMVLVASAQLVRMAVAACVLLVMVSATVSGPGTTDSMGGKVFLVLLFPQMVEAGATTVHLTTSSGLLSRILFEGESFSEASTGFLERCRPLCICRSQYF